MGHTAVLDSKHCAWKIIFWGIKVKVILINKNIDYLNVNRPIFDLPMFTIFSTAHPPKTNTIS